MTNIHQKRKDCIALLNYEVSCT